MFLISQSYYLSVGDDQNATAALDAASSYIEAAIASTTPNPVLTGFLKGDPGMYSVAAVIRNLTGDYDGSQAAIQEVLLLFFSNN